MSRRVKPPSDRLTTENHWEQAWAIQPRWRLPSGLVVGTRNMQRILRPLIQPGMRVLEVGCAPGKILAWTAATLGARVSGLDFSRQGVEWTRKLFAALDLVVDVRCEDLLATSFDAGSFDVVYSFGLIEHFADPRPVVRRHVELAAPGGQVIVGVPHYGGIYGRLQKRLAPDNLALHNLAIMQVPQLAALAPRDLVSDVRAYPAGRLSPWLISLDRALPRHMARACNYLLNGVGLLQPVDVAAVAPMLVLQMRRR